MYSYSETEKRAYLDGLRFAMWCSVVVAHHMSVAIKEADSGLVSAEPNACCQHRRCLPPRLGQVSRVPNPRRITKH